MAHEITGDSIREAQVVIVPLRALRPAPWNPRSISTAQFEGLKKSLQRDPQLLRSRPVLAMSDGTIYAGNMRYRAAAALPKAWRREHFGSDGIPAVIEDLSLDQAKERALRDNGSWGEWAEQDLAEILAGLDAQGVDVGTLGLGTDEVERLLALVGLGLGNDETDFDPTPPAIAQSRMGDVYLLGPHRLVCGDSRDPSAWDVLFRMADRAEANAMWTDPPYGVGLQVEGAAAMDGDDPSEVGPLLRATLPLADRRLVPGASWYICAPTGRTFAAFAQEIDRTGWYHAQTLVWVKNAFVPGRSDYHYQHETVLYGWKRGAAHRWLAAPDQATVFDDEPNPSRMGREELVALVKQLRNARETDVVREDKTRHNDLHPTMKPTGLIRQMLANSTRRGEVVLDPFAGSGSTMVACELLGRRAVMIEIEPRFCDVIVRRWTELSAGNCAELIRG